MFILTDDNELFVSDDKICFVYMFFVVARFPLGFRDMASSTEIKHDGNLTSANPTMKTRSTTGEFFACYAEVIEGKRDTLEKTVDISDDDNDDEEEDYPFDGVFPLEVFPRSRHRDGSIYRNMHPWIRDYRVTDRRESKLSMPLFPLRYWGRRFGTRPYMHPRS
jgi:hypothetical protein